LEGGRVELIVHGCALGNIGKKKIRLCNAFGRQGFQTSSFVLSLMDLYAWVCSYGEITYDLGQL